MRMPFKQLSTEPLWPTQRGLSRYQSLLDIDIAQALSAGGIWIDIGPGVEALPMVPFIDRPDVQLKCIGLHPRSLSPAIEFVQGSVPDDRSFLKSFAGQATLVTDVYSSVSYSDNPYLALAYCVLLLKAGGRCGVFTELKRLGDLSAWDRAIQFFRTTLHTFLSFHATPIFEDASQSMATALRIQAHREDAPPIDFDHLIASLQEEIGKPAITGTIWKAEDHSAMIQQIDYRRAP
jgi:hypothetical protein